MCFNCCFCGESLNLVLNGPMTLKQLPCVTVKIGKISDSAWSFLGGRYVN